MEIFCWEWNWKEKCTFQEILICSMEPNTKLDCFFIFQNVRKKKYLSIGANKYIFIKILSPFATRSNKLNILQGAVRLWQFCCRPCLYEHYAITPMKLWLDGPENNNTNNLIIVRVLVGLKIKHKMFDRICSLALILQPQLFSEQHFQ